VILTAEMAQGLDFCFKTGALAEKGVISLEAARAAR
jgi:hypothetical protein